MELGQKIKIARENKNLTRTELAKEIGIRCAAIISSWESGNSKPTTMTSIKNLCTTLDISLYDLFDMEPPKETILPDYQVDIVSKMKFMDSIAEKRIIDVVNEEYDRCRTTKSSVPVLFQLRIQQPLFIGQTDPDYKKNKKRVRTLKKVRIQKALKIEWITQFLWMIGFDGLICIADICAIFNETLVPSNQLCNCISLCVSETYKEKTPKEMFDQLYDENYNS